MQDFVKKKANMQDDNLWELLLIELNVRTTNSIV
jgi:hypothetical protein